MQRQPHPTCSHRMARQRRARGAKRCTNPTRWRASRARAFIRCPTVRPAGRKRCSAKRAPSAKRPTEEDRPALQRGPRDLEPIVIARALEKAGAKIDRSFAVERLDQRECQLGSLIVAKLRSLALKLA